MQDGDCGRGAGFDILYDIQWYCAIILWCIRSRYQPDPILTIDNDLLMRNYSMGCINIEGLVNPTSRNRHDRGALTIIRAQVIGRVPVLFD